MAWFVAFWNAFFVGKKCRIENKRVTREDKKSGKQKQKNKAKVGLELYIQ